MPHLRLEHFLSYTSANSTSESLDQYRSAGFIVSNNTIRHEPGLHNGFVHIGSEYLELCWVEDEELFRQASANEKSARESHRPFAIGIETDDIRYLHDSWIRSGFEVPDVWSKAPRDAEPDSAPVWSFQDVPDGLLPGAQCFVITYLRRERHPLIEPIIHPNSIFAVSGVSFVAADLNHAGKWRQLLAPAAPTRQTEASVEFRIGPHVARWMTLAAYESRYDVSWTETTHPYAEIGTIDLFAVDLKLAHDSLKHAGRQVSLIREADIEILFVHPSETDGFAFTIQQEQPEAWAAKRMKSD